MIRSLAVALAFSFVVAAPAVAQAPEDDSGLRTYCVDDYFRFCSAYPPGSPAIKPCFIRNGAKLSPACRSAIRAFDQRKGGRRS